MAEVPFLSPKVMIPTSTSLSFCFFDPRERPWDLKVPIWCRGQYGQRGDVSKPCDSEQFLRAAMSIFLLAWTPQQIDIIFWSAPLRFCSIFWPIDLSLHSRSLVRTAPDRSPKPWKHRPYLGEPWSLHTYKILSLPYRQKCCWSVTLI